MRCHVSVIISTPDITRHFIYFTNVIVVHRNLCVKICMIILMWYKQWYLQHRMLHCNSLLVQICFPYYEDNPELRGECCWFWDTAPGIYFHCCPSVLTVKCVTFTPTFEKFSPGCGEVSAPVQVIDLLVITPLLPVRFALISIVLIK